MIKHIGLILILISFILIVISIFNERRSFFNIKNVLKEHFKIFESCKSQYIVFYGAPLFLSIGLAMIYDSTTSFYDSLAVIISIVLSMLFAVLAIITSYDYSNYNDEEMQTRILKVVKETINSIVFETFICILLLIYGMIIIILQDVLVINVIINKILTGVACFLFIVLLLDLLIVIKRINKIMEIKINERNQNP